MALMMLKFNIGFPRDLDSSKLINGRRSFSRVISKTLGVVFRQCQRRPTPLNTPLRIQLAAIARGSSDYADGNN